jgi:tetratricopeptide (TPR) repeat protein
MEILMAAMKTGRTAVTLGAVVFLCAMTAATAALAFGGDATPTPPPQSGHSTTTTNQNAGPPPVDCVKTKGQGWTYDYTKKTCVKVQAMNDPSLYESGRQLALAGHYQDALDLLDRISDKNDAMVLTMIGYSTRKLGDLSGGIAIYYKALAIDPNNVNTREYLGEGYLAAGRVDLAEAELDKLQTLCGTTCVQYQALSRALAGDTVWTD